MIKKNKGGYCVVAETGRNMGTYKTLEKQKSVFGRLNILNT